MLPCGTAQLGGQVVDDDIVYRLRYYRPCRPQDCTEAAVLIEQLRAQLAWAEGAAKAAQDGRLQAFHCIPSKN